MICDYCHEDAKAGDEDLAEEIRRVQQWDDDPDDGDDCLICGG